MRIPRLAPSFRVVLSAIGVSLVLAACGGGGGGNGSGGFFLPTSPATGGNTPPDSNPPAGDPSGPPGNLPDTPPDNPPPPPVTPVVSCADLSGKSLPASLISLPTQGATVTSATPVAAADVGNTLGDYCKRARHHRSRSIRGAPIINFALNLPDQLEPARRSSSVAAASMAVLIDGTEVDPFRPRRQAGAARARLCHLR
jgi:hypothetical protein